MPNTRGKLIELLKYSPFLDVVNGYKSRPTFEMAADHLIANGVTVQRDCHWATEQAYKNGYEKGKADAVKEFAERLKEYKYLSSDWSHGEHPFVVEEADIDELMEEMVGVEPPKGE